jgi:KH/beta-lactamase-domain protein
MGDIVKEILKIIPKELVSESAFEGANIVLYTKDKEFFLDNKGMIRKAVKEFKKRIELRPDPSIALEQEKAREIIMKVMPKEAGITNIFFDSARSEVVIEAAKPGLAIGKQGALLREVRSKTFWVPLIMRAPAIKSELIENIRAVLYNAADERKKFLDRTGHRIYDGWIRNKKTDWVRLTYLGAARQIGRSCLFLQTPESRILMDCGIDVSSSDEAYPFLEVPEFNIQDLDAVIVSHSHTDHCGMVPYLFKFGYRGPVYCTAPTRDIMCLLQLDYVKIQKMEYLPEIYSQDDVKEMVKHTITLGWEEVTDITPDVRLTFYNSGHILGSSMVHLHIGNGLHNMLYTADMNYAKTMLLAPAQTTFPRLETLMIESTYGGRNNIQAPAKEQMAYLATIIKETVARGGKVLMPTLGSGRAQEVMLMIEQMVRNKEIEPTTIYIDGMVWDVTAIYTAYPEFMNSNVRKMIFHKDHNPFLSPILKRIGSSKERKELCLRKEPCVIIATSGMLVGGPSVQYLRMMASDPKHSLVFSCYQGEGTLGRKIQGGQRELHIKEGNKVHMVPIKMEVHRIEVSAHAGRKQLMNFVSNCSPRPRRVIVNHGETGKCLDLASSIHKEFRMETQVPKNLETVRLR